MKLKFILFIAFRYFKARRKSRKTATSMLLSLSIAIGIMALTVVIGIMNGFQLSFIEPILEVNSYHLQISGPPLSPQQSGALRDLKEVSALVPFAEYQGLINEESPVLIRAIPTDAWQQDAGFAASFRDYSKRTGRHYDLPGDAELAEPRTIVLGNVLLNDYIFRGRGDRITIISPADNPIVELKVNGSFMTGYFDIDAGWGFISLETARLFHTGSGEPPIQYGIKLVNHHRDARAVEKIQQLLGAEYKVQSWRVFNSNFFRTLRTEKILMSLVIGLIFIIVAFGIFNSLRKTVHEKAEEIALLKALGTSALSIKLIFIVEGLLIGLSGGLLGTGLGLFVAYNVNEIFRLTERIVNSGVLPFLQRLLAPYIPGIKFPPISILSPEVYYMDEVPVRVLLDEAVFANLFAILFSVVAAHFASRKIAAFKPASVLRYE